MKKHQPKNQPGSLLSLVGTGDPTQNQMHHAESNSPLFSIRAAVSSTGFCATCDWFHMPSLRNFERRTTPGSLPQAPVASQAWKF